MVGQTVIHQVNDPEARTLLQRHADINAVHSNLDPLMCSCAKAKAVKTISVPSGDACFVCGGLTVRTGTCTTCTSCGTSGGCG